MFRSKVKWTKQGEKLTKYFFNLEKKHYLTKTLLQIKLHNGENIQIQAYWCPAV